jgi:F-type H+-transporting ATPase subunit delta
MDSRAVSRYVKSLLDLSITQKVLEEVHNDMLLFSKVVNENKSFALMLKSPVIRHDTKRDVMEKLFKGKVNQLTIAFLDIITKKNREPLLPAIAREFHNSYNEQKGIRKAIVTSAIPLDAKLRGEMESLVKANSSEKQVELIEKVDPEMIGGFVLNIGDRQIDASIKNKLKALKLEFSQNPYVKEF